MWHIQGIAYWWNNGFSTSKSEPKEDGSPKSSLRINIDAARDEQSKATDNGSAARANWAATGTSASATQSPLDSGRAMERPRSRRYVGVATWGFGSLAIDQARAVLQVRTSPPLCEAIVFSWLLYE